MKPLLPLLLLFAALAPTRFARAAELPVDDFLPSQVGALPETWKTYPLQRGKAERVYRVAQEGDSRFLRAVDGEDLSVTIFRGFKWDVTRFPYLKFRWRAQALPQMAPAEWSAVDDHACGLFIGFGFTSALKYVWSSTFPAGSFWAKRPGKYVIVTKEYGPEHAGQWREVTVDVRADYERFLGKALKKNPSGVAILSDGESSHQRVACDYADIRISDQP